MNRGTDAKQKDTLTCWLYIGPSTVDPSITEELPAYTLSREPALLVETVTGSTRLLEWGHHKSQGLVLLHLLGVDIDPDVHLFVLLLIIDPPCERSGRKLKADHPLLVPGYWQLHVPTVLIAEVGGHKEDVSPKLEIIFTAARHAGPTQPHLLYEDREPVAGGGEVQLQVALQGVPHHEGGVEGENTDNLLLHFQPGFAPV